LSRHLIRNFFNEKFADDPECERIDSQTELLQILQITAQLTAINLPSQKLIADDLTCQNTGLTPCIRPS
jgi:hypothetical protein